MSTITGKRVALTGKFTTMKRAEASKRLEALGAVVVSGVSKKLDILVAGQKAGSKRTKAQSLGITIHDEAWLIDVLGAPSSGPSETEETQREASVSGVDLSTPPNTESALADFFERLEAIVDEFSEDPRLRVGYLRQPPITEAALTRIEGAWNCKLSAAIKDLYRQANGFLFYWVGTHDADNRAAWADRDMHFFSSIHVSRPGHRPTQRAPVVADAESFPNSTVHGFAWLLPLDKVLVRKRAYIDFLDHGDDRDLRVFEYGAGGTFPAAFSMDPGHGDPPVLVGSDHGASWTDCAAVSFETYMENLLATYASTDMRKRATTVAGRGVREAQIDFESLLPPSETLVCREDGATFEVEILAVEQLSAVGARAHRIASEYASALNSMGKKGLGISAPSKLDRMELAMRIAKATADMKALDAKSARALGSPIYVKTKKALAEKLFCNMPSATRVTLQVKPVFEAASLRADDFKGFFEYNNGLSTVLSEHAAVESSRIVSSKKRVFLMEATLEPGHSLETGQLLTSTAIPPGYRLYRGTVYRDYWRKFV